MAERTVRDHYQVLGIARAATAEEIKRAYRRLARELHPDTNPDPGAETQFKEVAHAYEVLSDPERRQRYDTYGDDESPSGGQPFGNGFGGFGDIFDAFFGGGSPFGAGGGSRTAGGPPSGPDLEAAITLDFEDAVFGTQAPVTVRTAVACVECEGSGAMAGTFPTTCPDCGGTGQVRRVRQSILGQMVTAGPCGRCQALGSIIDHPCPECRGEGRAIEEQTYTVEIPAGIEDGRAVRLAGRGAAGPRGGRAGDLYIHVRVRPHERFERHGNDLLCELPISFAQAALGCLLQFSTLDGVEDMVIERSTQTGRMLRLRGRGVPYVEGRGRGDLLVRVVVETPTQLSGEEEEALRRLASLRGEDVAPPEDGFFSKIRSAFK
jgi:molecular chaperone DnaJ